MSNYDSIVHFCQRESEIDLTEAIAQARTEWLKNWLLEHLPKIAELEDTPEDHEFARQWDAMAKEMMADRGLVTPSQQKNRLTDIRNALKTLNPNHPALADVGFTSQEWEAINRSSEQRVSDRNTKFLSDPDAIVEKAIALLDSNDWSDLAAGLAVLTGRRCAEILQTAEFEYKSHYSVTFSGSLKRRSEPVNLQFEIPTLASASVVIDALAKLREWVDTKGLDNRAINNKYAHAVINSSDRHFRELVPTRDGEDNLYTHLFRAVYATIATHWYCPPNVPELEFRAYIQGHFKILDENNPELRRSLAASRNYFDYKIADGQGNVDGRLGIKLAFPNVTVVEAFESYYQPPIRDDDNHDEAVPNNSQPIPEPEPLTDEELVKALVSMLDSSDDEVLLTGLMGVTGRTPGELLKSGVFRLSPDGMVLFSPTGLTQSSPLPTLVEGPKVIDAIACLRHHPDVQSELYLSPNQINDHCHAKVEPVITQSLGLKDIKELYANYTHLCSLQEISVTSEPSMATELDWADVAKSLAQSLNLDSPTQLQDWFDQLPFDSTPHTHTYTHTQDESDELKRMFSSQQQSLNHLTDAISNLVVTLKGEETTTTQENTNHTLNPGKQKVNRAIDAIIDYNNNQATKTKDKWRITISALKQLTKCNQGLIARVIEKRQTEIEQHHQTHQLGQYHNSKGKMAPSISDVISSI
ncbi:protelomerase family protein [Cyanothece sp. BG0011]|uniref:protelomerase family protein n=1 Tax=Cyanothece sp. BG0011 TaxID=2082950 RepID=UPI000D1ED95B|nr:protelomerase family protein [Cyanothece sp. BG0011]